MRRKSSLKVKAVEMANQDGIPWIWISLGLVVLALLSLGTAACGAAPAQVAVALPAEVSIDEAHDMYEEDIFFLDVRTQE